MNNVAKHKTQHAGLVDAHNQGYINCPLSFEYEYLKGFEQGLFNFAYCAEYALLANKRYK
jgi:hypothetical protein